MHRRFRFSAYFWDYLTKVFFPLCCCCCSSLFHKVDRASVLNRLVCGYLLLCVCITLAWVGLTWLRNYFSITNNKKLLWTIDKIRYMNLTGNKIFSKARRGGDQVLRAVQFQFHTLNFKTCSPMPPHQNSNLEHHPSIDIPKKNNISHLFFWKKKEKNIRVKFWKFVFHQDLSLSKHQQTLEHLHHNEIQVAVKVR